MPKVIKTPAWQQRVFVGTLQKFSQVEIISTSTARDVLEILQVQGMLEDHAANGWMMWEVSQDFGMGASLCLHRHVRLLIMFLAILSQSARSGASSCCLMCATPGLPTKL